MQVTAIVKLLIETRSDDTLGLGDIFIPICSVRAVIKLRSHDQVIFTLRTDGVGAIDTECRSPQPSTTLVTVATSLIDSDLSSCHENRRSENIAKQI